MRVWLFFLILVSYLYAEDVAPWFPKDLEIRPTIDDTVYVYKKVRGKDRSFSKKAINHSFSLSLASAYDAWAAEFRAGIARTKQHGWIGDAFSGMLRYQWLSDTVGDAVSFVTGLRLGYAPRLATRDFSLFHHGKVFGGVHISVGKEWAYRSFWLHRLWGMVEYGVASRGAPWVSSECFFEKNGWDEYNLGLGFRFLYGLGSHGISSFSHFKGYGGIQHQTIDAIFRFWRKCDCDVEVDLEFGVRVHARNAPDDAFMFRFALAYPFGL